MTSPAHVRSYYAASAHALPVFPALQGEVECDVCVVGGGLAGISSALHLAERGYRVVLVEARRLGWGASGRSGGQVLPGYACGQEKLTSLVGPEVSRRLWDMSVEAVALVRKLIRRYGIECDWVDGHLQAAIKPRHRSELLSELGSLQKQYDYTSVRFVERTELQALLATERYIAGLYDSNAGHLHPLNFTLGLAAAAQRAGVQIFENTRALSFRHSPHLTVQCSSSSPPSEGRAASFPLPSPASGRGAGGEGLSSIRCSHLILCGNTYLNGAAPELARKIIDIGTYIVATEPLGEARARELIANNMAVSDMNWILDYFRRSADHRLLFGGRVTYSGLRDDAAPATRARMIGVFPQLADVKIDYAWGGHLDITLNRAPHFGRLAPDVYFLQGFSGHGLALTCLAGKLIAEAVGGTAERFDLFTRIPHRDFPGGPLLRRPALMLAMLYYRLRDLL